MKDIPQHKNIAMGGDKMPAQDFGVAPFASVNGSKSAHPDAGMSHAPLADADRSVGKPVRRDGGQMPATRHSDHGPHFGVGSIK